MYTAEEYDNVLSRLRMFFRSGKEYIEVDGQKDLSILGAYVAFLSFCSKALKLESLILSNDLSNNSAPLVDIFFERLS